MGWFPKSATLPNRIHIAGPKFTGGRGQVLSFCFLPDDFCLVWMPEYVRAASFVLLVSSRRFLSSVNARICQSCKFCPVVFPWWFLFSVNARICQSCKFCSVVFPWWFLFSVNARICQSCKFCSVVFPWWFLFSVNARICQSCNFCSVVFFLMISF